MSARGKILGSIRAAQGKPAEAAAEERERVRAHLAARPANARPAPPRDLRAEFRSRALALSSTLDDIAAMSAAPQAVAAFLTRNALPLTAVCWPELDDLDWAAAGLHVAARTARDGDLVGITGAYCGIAETGTLMLLSTPRAPATVSLVPETHIALLRAGRIVSGMEEAWKLLRSEMPALPRAVNFVSGPSRTADIEQTVTLGAHGPYRVHIVLVGS